MDTVTLKNFRCFSEEQTARLAPLTLLVGENSTGKTSFLALLRALWRVAAEYIVPDFREDPYDLGTFRDIAHHRGGRGGSADFFEAGLEFAESSPEQGPVSLLVTFKEREGVPYPTRRRLTGKDTWIEVDTTSNGQELVRFRRQQNEWERLVPAGLSGVGAPILMPLTVLLRHVWREDYRRVETTANPNASSDDGLPTQGDLDAAGELESALRRRVHWSGTASFAGAPLRAQPRRTYDPSQPFSDPRGDYVPTYLANLSRRDQKEWHQLKLALENFGQVSGLFNEIYIESFGKTDADPFQVKVRKFGKRSKGYSRNIIDVGYGVSQALPLLTELFKPQPAPLFLLQQPEVHLHPSAQAALGTLFCSIAGPNRQLVVETHSDYILDRVLMDIRDQKTGLKPDDVSILFFEPNDLEGTIHSLRLDKQGNILGVPNGYRQFFSDELRRSIGL